MLREFFPYSEGGQLPLINASGKVVLVPQHEEKSFLACGYTQYPLKWEVWDNGKFTGWMIPARNF
jgi:hypothetical protein